MSCFGFVIFISMFPCMESSLVNLDRKEDSILTRFVGLQQRYDNLFLCLKLCSQIPVCKSINFIGNQSVCHINNERADEISVLLTPFPGCIYIDVNNYTKQEISGACENNACGSDEMCVVKQDGYICYPLNLFGYSFKPNRCVNIVCESWLRKYNESLVPGITDGRVVSMVIQENTSRSSCKNVGSFYNWKDKTVFVNQGCRATFNVCFTLF